MTDFTLDIKRIKERAREHMMSGAVTDSYGLDKEKVIDVLDQMLATELVCALRYRNHHHAASGLKADLIAGEFLTHAEQEEEHAHRLATRIAQLGGTPNLDPASLTGRSHSDYRPASNLREMIEENLVAERVAIESYSQLIRWLGDHDATTRRIVEDILAVEEEHADELASLLEKQ